MIEYTNQQLCMPCIIHAWPINKPFNNNNNNNNTKTAEKWGMEGPGQKSVVMALIRAKIGVAIVRGTSWCVRGDREGRNKYVESRGARIDGEDRAELRFLFSSQASHLPS